MSERTYTEEEVAELLQRAAELQAQAARRAEHRPGLTIDELESIGTEAGLDPSLIRQAAAELDAPERPMLRRNSGLTSSHVFVERRLPGTLSPEHWEDVVAELRHQFESDLGKMMGMPQYGSGTTEQIGRTVEWKHTSMSGIETKVLIRPHGDWLDVRLSQRVGWASPPAEGAMYGLTIALLAGLFTGGVVDSFLVGAIVAAAALVVSIPLITYADRAWRKKKHRELEALADRITAIVGSPVDNSSIAAEEDVASSDRVRRQDPSLLETEEFEPEPRRSAARRTREI